MDYDVECPRDCRVVREMKRKSAKSNRRSTKIKRRKNFLNRRLVVVEAAFRWRQALLVNKL